MACIDALLYGMKWQIRAADTRVLEECIDDLSAGYWRMLWVYSAVGGEMEMVLNPITHVTLEDIDVSHADGHAFTRMC